MATKKQVEKFIKLRNKSEFSSNMQFHIDADACGFKVEDLGDVVKVGPGEYVWTLPFGKLREHLGKLALE